MRSKKGGRPSKEDKKLSRIDIRMSAEEKDMVVKMANYYGKSMSQFVKELLERQRKEYVKDSFFENFEFDKD